MMETAGCGKRYGIEWFKETAKFILPMISVWSHVTCCFNGFNSKVFIFEPLQVISTTEFSNHLVGGFNRNISQTGWFPQVGGKNAKCLSCQHLATYTRLKPSSECFPPNPLGCQKYATSGDQLPIALITWRMGSQVSLMTSFLPIYKPTKRSKRLFGGGRDNPSNWGLTIIMAN